MIAALGPPEEAKSEKLLQVLAEMPMASFIDGDQDARDFSHSALNKVGMAKLFWKAIQVADNLTDDLGLNPGNKFFDWLTDQLLRAGVQTNAALLQRLRTVPRGLRLREGRTDEEIKPDDAIGRLIMVAADITTETKVEFPRMAELYWTDPDRVNPACFARASMSIPFFFHPFRVDHCPQDRAKWQSPCRFWRAASGKRAVYGRRHHVQFSHQPLSSGLPGTDIPDVRRENRRRSGTARRDQQTISVVGRGIRCGSDIPSTSTSLHGTPTTNIWSL